MQQVSYLGEVLVLQEQEAGMCGERCPFDTGTFLCGFKNGGTAKRKTDRQGGN